MNTNNRQYTASHDDSDQTVKRVVFRMRNQKIQKFQRRSNDFVIGRRDNYKYLSNM